MGDRSSSTYNLSTPQPLKTQNPPSKLSSLLNLYRKFCTSQALGGHQNPLRRERACCRVRFIVIKTDDGVYRLKSLDSGFTLDSPPTYAFWLHSSFYNAFLHFSVVTKYARAVRRVQMLKREERMLEREVDILRSEKSKFETQLGENIFATVDPEALRVVNAERADIESTQSIETLIDELLITQEKFETLMNELADAGTHVDVNTAVKIKQLKDQIAKLGNHEETYKAVFAEKLSVFRRVCYELFGYKIAIHDHVRSDGIPVTRFILHSVYATREDEKLQFEYDSGNFYIVENDYTSQPEISQEVNTYIRRMNSIPAFTANLIAESFVRSTQI